jgi:hypothetical protein
VPTDRPAASVESVIALPNARGVVYVVRTGLSSSSAGVNVVYLARPRERPRRLYARRVPWLSCGESASISFANGRILYVDDEGPIAVLDPSGRTPPRELTREFRVLQPRRSSRWQLNADWASKWR